ncbi:WecB/TagA/CpsF family glycosyltransferase [Candidatus Peregrinibacteria bacterium]|nr:WecB/TagA/CpsF family glycosyltransferase [Candidatus Peregrinibacteria bacterium]
MKLFSIKKIKILGVPFDACTKEEALARIHDVLHNRLSEKGKHIVTPNPEMLMEAKANPLFKKVLNQAWMSIPDGAGILWASTYHLLPRTLPRRRWLGWLNLVAMMFAPSRACKALPERVTGIDLMEGICRNFVGTNRRIFLLGGAPGIAEKAKNMLEKKCPGVSIAGTFSGSPQEEDFPGIQSLIAELRPEVLFVAFGSPLQELWIHHYLPALPSVKIAMGVGGAFDFLAGKRKRAPQFMRKMGLEWLYRLIQEPSRLRRIWNATVRFPREVMKN